MNDINADDAEFGMSDHKTHNELRAEIASLRAQLAECQRRERVTVTGRAVLECDRLRTAARQDAERVEAAFAERDSYMASNTKLVERIRQDAEDRAADIEAAEKRGYDCGVNDITRQDAEETVRLKEALKPFAQAADEVDRYAEDRRLASTFENNLTVSHLRDARAACRPQGERSET